MNHDTTYLGQKSFRFKVIGRTERQTDRQIHTTERLLYLDGKVVGNSNIELSPLKFAITFSTWSTKTSDVYRRLVSIRYVTR